MSRVDTPSLRQCVLAVSVLRDIDVTPSDAGVVIAGPRAAVVAWTAVRDAVGAHDPSGPTAQRRVETLLRLHRVASDLGPAAAERFRSAARVLALPPGHAEHPGAEWVQEPLAGNALDLGVAVLGLLGEMGQTTPVAPSVLRSINADPKAWWPELREHAERMGSLSAARLTRDGDTGLIRPVGGCDVLSLLSSRALRQHLAQSDGSGLRVLAAPSRRRAWFNVSQIDPAFIQAAWSLTEDHERGMPIPLLITADTVTLPFGP